MKPSTFVHLLRQAETMAHHNSHVNPDVCVVVDVDLKEGEISGVADVQYSITERAIVITTRER